MMNDWPLVAIVTAFLLCVPVGLAITSCADAGIVRACMEGGGEWIKGDCRAQEAAR